jgi:hypothetical protein
MKPIFFFALFLVTAFACSAQKKFRLSSLVGKQLVIVNGKRYTIDSSITKIPTKYPQFDDLRFDGDNWGAETPIICNFKPDSSYAIAPACCAGIDIIPLSRFRNDSLKYWGDDEANFSRIQKQFMDRPFISIRTKEQPKDSVYAWHADAACMTEHSSIGTSLWRLGVPPKCFYWNNITSVLFYKQGPKLAKPENEDLEGFLEMKNIIKLASIEFRIFDNERIILVYDEKHNTIAIKRE